MYYEIVGTNARLAGSLHQWPADSGTGDLPHWVWDAYRWSEKIYLEPISPKPSHSFVSRTAAHFRMYFRLPFGPH